MPFQLFQFWAIGISTWLLSSSPLRQKICDGAYALGRFHQTQLKSEEIIAFNTYLCALGYELVSNGESVTSFKRAQVKGTTYFTEAYDRVQKRNGYTVMYQQSGGQPEFGLLQIFIKLNSCILALVCNLEPVNFPLLAGLGPFRGLQNTVAVARGGLRAIPITSIQEKCMFIEISSLPRAYVVRFPNLVEQS